MDAQIAQSVEQRTENPRVTGSIPVLGIFYGPLAQVVEHLTFNQVVRGSSPRWLTRIKTVEHGSNLQYCGNLTRDFRFLVKENAVS